jgi:hypothetical protein
MTRITISYRRDDSLDITGRIFDRLATHYGRDSIFRDIDNVPAGADFRKHIDIVLEESDIILAIVGPRWIEPRAGQSRLADSADPVRLEIETALRKGKPLIPVLVSRARMPRPDQLPESLHEFAYRNAVQVDAGQDFDVHIDRLIRSMDRLLERGDQSRETNGAVSGVIEPPRDAVDSGDSVLKLDVLPESEPPSPTIESATEDTNGALKAELAAVRAALGERDTEIAGLREAQAIRPDRGGQKWPVGYRVGVALVGAALLVGATAYISTRGLLQEVAAANTARQQAEQELKTLREQLASGNPVTGVYLTTPFMAVTAHGAENLTLPLTLRNFKLPPTSMDLSIPKVANGWTATILGDGRPVTAVIISTNTDERMQLLLEQLIGVGPGDYHFLVEAKGGGVDLKLPITVTVVSS